MVLTPDQKRRIAELESQAPAEEEKEQSPSETILSRLKRRLPRIHLPFVRGTILKIGLALIIVALAGYYAREYQLHRLHYKEIFSFRGGNPVDRFLQALKEQKEKTEMLETARAQFLGGEYADSLHTAGSVANLDAKDTRAQELIDLASDAAIQKASREFDTGEIEAALGDLRLALKYRPEHEEGRRLSVRIGQRLLAEANAHYSKKEYAQLIKKAKEVIKLNPSDMAATNLLVKTNNELLDRADQHLYNRRYFDALEKVQLSLKIDPSNSRAVRLLEQISLYVETPNLKLRGITKFGKTLYAVIQLPNSSQPIYMKKGETVRNFRLVDIDPETKIAKFLQVYTKAEFIIPWSKPD